MKLISMTDFVLNNHNKIMNTIYNDGALTGLTATKWANYAKFLKQPLELWMFVPCDESGNVLEEPKEYQSWLDIQKVGGYSLCHNSNVYHKAKEHILFEDFKVCNRLESVKCIVNETLDFHFSYQYSIDRKETIESLIKYNLTLTPNAIKQLGL